MLATRELAVGTKLHATYKKTVYTCGVVGPLEGNTTPEGNRYRLEDGRDFKSLSSAGKAVMNGTSCNGWRFWSLEGEASPTKAAKANGNRKLVRQISKLPNQKGIPQTGDEIVVRHYCAACQKAFLAADAAPANCPEGHPREVVDDLALVN